MSGVGRVGGRRPGRAGLLEQGDPALEDDEGQRTPQGAKAQRWECPANQGQTGEQGETGLGRPDQKSLSTPQEREKS